MQMRELSTQQSNWSARTRDDSSSDKHLGYWGSHAKSDRLGDSVGCVVEVKYGKRYWEAVLLSVRSTDSTVKWTYDGSETTCENHNIRVKDTDNRYNHEKWGGILVARKMGSMPLWVPAWKPSTEINSWMLK